VVRVRGRRKAERARSRGCLVALVVLAVASAGVVESRAAAIVDCSFVAPREALAGADAAFIGTLLAVHHSNEDSGLLHTYRVERVVKGDLGTTVRVKIYAEDPVFGRPGDRVALLLYRTPHRRYVSSACSQLSPEALLAAARPLPGPTSPGPPASVVGGALGHVRTVAIDAAGGTVAYGRGPGETVALVPCPGGEHVLEVVVADEPPRVLIAATRTSDLHTEWSWRVPPGWGVSGIQPECLDADGVEVLVFLPGGMRGGAPEGKIVDVVAGDRSQTIRVAGRTAVFRGTTVYLARERRGGVLDRLDVETGTLERVTEIPQHVQVLALSPDGSQLAGLVGVTGNRSGHRLFVADLGRHPPIVTSRRVPASFPPSLAWRGENRLAYVAGHGLGGTGGQALVFDERLELLTRRRGAVPAPAALAATGALGVDGERVVAFPLGGGPARTLATFEGSELEAVLALPLPAPRPPSPPGHPRSSPMPPASPAGDPASNDTLDVTAVIASAFLTALAVALSRRRRSRAGAAANP
jgi:hypothetical protein